MVVTVYILAVLLFCVTFYRVRMINSCHQILALANNAAAIFSDSSLDDLARERAIQKSDLSMVKHCLILFIKMLVTLGFTFLPLWLASTMNFATPHDIRQFATRWDVLILTTVIVILPVVILRSRVT